MDRLGLNKRRAWFSYIFVFDEGSEILYILEDFINSLIFSRSMARSANVQLTCGLGKRRMCKRANCIGRFLFPCITRIYMFSSVEKNLICIFYVSHLVIRLSVMYLVCISEFIYIY